MKKHGLLLAGIPGVPRVSMMGSYKPFRSRSFGLLSPWTAMIARSSSGGYKRRDFRRDDQGHDGSMSRAAVWRRPSTTQGAMADRQRFDLRRLVAFSRSLRLSTSSLASRRSKVPERNCTGEAFVKTFKRDYVWGPSIWERIQWIW
jgi:hypothetical protein